MSGIIRALVLSATGSAAPDLESCFWREPRVTYTYTYTSTSTTYLVIVRSQLNTERYAPKCNLHATHLLQMRTTTSVIVSSPSPVTPTRAIISASSPDASSLMSPKLLSLLPSCKPYQETQALTPHASVIPPLVLSLLRATPLVPTLLYPVYLVDRKP